MTDIIMPRLSDSMEEGTILKWLKSPGEEVRVGEPLAEIETDKATMTYEADAAGFLQPVAAEGDTLSIGAVIGRLLDDASAALAPAAAASPDGNGAATQSAEPLTPSAQPAAAPAAAPAAEPAAPSAAAPAAQSVDVAPVSRAARELDEPPAPPPGRIRASPVARRIARELEVDLAVLVGSGPEGRIVKADVIAASERGPAAAPATAAGEADTGGAKGAVEVVEPNRIQQLIARRMASAKATIPEFQVTVDVDAEAAFELREQLRGQAEPLPSLNDFVIKACALALRAHPRVNGAYIDGHFEYYSRINIGMAVASEGSLIVPTIFDADVRSLVEIATATRALAAKVRDGNVSPPELAGGTFTVSNLGMFGVSRFTAVINPPQAAILAVGAATPRATFGEDGTISARRVMELTISADHRIVYGADAADFLGTVRKRLERPAGLLLTDGAADERLLAAHDIARVRAPNPGPYTLAGTNSWIVGREPAYVIDPGPASRAHLDALADEVAARGGAAAVLLTHDHADHAAGAAQLAERIGAPVAAMRAGRDIALHDGFAVGPFIALATPGHSGDHAAFLAGRVCFSGDLVLGEGSVMIAAEPGALAAYLASLERLRGLDLELIAPGHGPLVTDPVAKLVEYRAHRLDRERRLLEALADGLRDRDELLDRVWSDVPAALRPAAAATLAAHLGKLEDEGRLPEP